MDKHLKERMIGALVLVATAIILIPEMLSGPHKTSDVNETPTPIATSDGAKLKTYTIDLAKATPQLPVESTPIADSLPKEIPPKESELPVKQESRAEPEPPRVEPPSSEAKQETAKPQRESKPEHETKPETPAVKSTPKPQPHASTNSGGRWAV